MQVTYSVSLRPPEHLLEVTARVTGAGTTPLRAIIPTWVPGAYAFLRYARNVYALRVTNGAGQALDCRRDGLTAWVVDAPGAETVFHYTVHLYEPAWSELHGFVEHDTAVLLGTNYLHFPAHTGPVEVQYTPPPGWMMHHPAGATALGTNHHRYPSFHALLDAPVTLGRFERLTRMCHGTPFHFVFLNRAVGFDAQVERFMDDAMKLVETCHAVFGHFPFEHYSFVCSFAPQHHWGLEHRASTMVAFGEHGLIDPVERMRAMRLITHELFHAWNVCSLKPREFLLPDLEHGSFTDLLWVAEGLTRYYEYLLPVRAGVMTPEELLSNVLNYFTHLRWLPAYQHVTAQDSSRATFMNHHRYPGSPNASVDYYDVGMLIAFDLDVCLLGQSPPRGLDSEFAEFYRTHVKDGFTHAQWMDFFGGRTPALKDVLTRDVTTAGGLGTLGALEALGFSVVEEPVPVLGVTLAEDKGPAILNVFEGSAAALCGLAPGDVLERVDGFPFSLKALRYTLDQKRALTLTVRRGHAWHTFQVTPGTRSAVTQLRFTGSDAHRARLQQWLRRPDFSPASGATISITPYDNFHGVHTLL